MPNFQGGDVSMRYIFIILITAITAFGSAGEAAAEMRISIVDIQQIMQDSVAAKSAKAQLNAKQQEFQGQLDARE